MSNTNIMSNPFPDLPAGRPAAGDEDEAHAPLLVPREVLDAAGAAEDRGAGGAGNLEEPGANPNYDEDEEDRANYDEDEDDDEAEHAEDDPDPNLLDPECDLGRRAARKGAPGAAASFIRAAAARFGHAARASVTVVCSKAKSHTR